MSRSASCVGRAAGNCGHGRGSFGERRRWRRSECGALRGRRFRGLKFRRQRPTGPFIADFACVELGLVVEVGGAIHDEPDVHAHDALRDEWLGNRQLRVLRLPAALVMEDLTSAMKLLGDAIDIMGAGTAIRPGRSARS